MRQLSSSIRFFAIIITATGLLWGLPDTAAADNNAAVGKVVAVRGKVVALAPDQKPRPLTLKSPIFLKDTIQTMKGRIQLMFADNTLLTLGSHSKMEITRYAWKSDGSQAAFETSIKEGSFRIMGGTITRSAPENFKTNTPSGTIGIRGSMYAGMVRNTLLSVVFLGGKGIYVKNDLGRVEIQRPGFGTQVKGQGRAPEPPQKVDAKQLRELESALYTAESTDSDPTDQEAGDAETQTDEPENTDDTDGTDTTDTEDEEDDSQSESATASDSSGSSGSSDSTDTSDQDTADQTPAIDTEASTADSTTTTDVSTSIAEVTSDAASAASESVQDSLAGGLNSDTVESKILLALIDLDFTEDLVQSTTTPSSGVWKYKGTMINQSTSEKEDITFLVNWYNKRIMSVENFDITSTSINNGFGFAQISSDGTISDLNIFGSDAQSDTGTVTALTGSETFGHFFGTGQTGLGIAMEGYDINLVNSSDQHFWSDITAAIQTGAVANDSGTETWSGFFVGVAENMAAPDTNRRVFHNTSTSHFEFIVNKDSGVLTGIKMEGSDFNDAGNSIADITIGGGLSNSVYIQDNVLAAELTGSSSSVMISSNIGGLKSYGNFMVSSGKIQLSSYTTWGYWEAAYEEPGTGYDYHIHVPGSLWIAGEPTGSTAVGTRIGGSFTGTYDGKAKGVQISSGHQMAQLTNGQTHLEIDFASTASLPVTGTLTFSEVTLGVTGTTAVSTSGFTATINSATSSEVNGTFYGPDVEAVGGNFSAEMSDGTQYHGIFAGDR